MKILSVLFSLLLLACSTAPQPAMLTGAPQAYATTAEGKVRAAANKWSADEGVCFDIAISIKEVEQEDLGPLSWNMAWKDQRNQYHLLKINPRDPASALRLEEVQAPYGAYKEWTNTFRTCALTANIDEVKSLVLTPQNLKLKGINTMELTWP